jgi:hypothetical protein
LTVPPQPAQSRESAELTEQVRREIGCRGSLVTTIEDLLVRVGEPDPTLEARVRAQKILAEHGIQTRSVVEVPTAEEGRAAANAASTDKVPSRARDRLAAALAESAAALAGNDQVELARALDGLGAAAQEFADALRAELAA